MGFGAKRLVGLRVEGHEQATKRDLTPERNLSVGLGSRARSQRLTVLAQTTMIRSLPPEILDLIIDHLHDEPATLRACCTASKSWVPRTRTHLFAHVKFTRNFPVGSWAEVFPDPSNSPAHYTRTLAVGHKATATAGTDVGRWIRVFHNVAHLHLSYHSGSFTLYHGLSPTVRSLRLRFPHAQPSGILALMCSFPLLEDFTLLLHDQGNEAGRRTTLSTSPRLTGSLELRSVIGGIGPFARRLLDLPNGLNFTRIDLSCTEETDFESTTDLVSGCSNTLEYLDVAGYVLGVFPSISTSGRCLTSSLRVAHTNFI